MHLFSKSRRTNPAETLFCSRALPGADPVSGRGQRLPNLAGIEAATLFLIATKLAQDTTGFACGFVVNSVHPAFQQTRRRPYQSRHHSPLLSSVQQPLKSLTHT